MQVAVSVTARDHRADAIGKSIYLSFYPPVQPKSTVLNGHGASSQIRGELSYISGSKGAMSSSRSTLTQGKGRLKPLAPCPQPLTPAVPGGRAYSALPCAGAPPPQRPLSYNMPRRPGVDICNRCPIEGISPFRVPPVPTNPPRDRSCACPGPQNQRTSRKGQALAPALCLSKRR